jgi:hypothetical protein
MALTWTTKPSDATYRLSWRVPVVSGDIVSGASLTVTSGTAIIDSYSIVDNDVVAYVSGGTVGAVTTISGAADTSGGETITETIYLPVTSSASALQNTGGDIAAFALRKVSGFDDPEANELTDALVRLSDMLASWAGQSMGVGVPLPVTEATVFLIPDEYISAIKANLVVRLVGVYGAQPSPQEQRDALIGYQLVRQSLATVSDVSYM